MGDLGNGITLVCRCEHDAVMIGPNGENQFINIKSLNEWDSKLAHGVDWRQKLDSQRGAVVATELKNNSCKLAKWTVSSLLAGSDQIKFGYVSRQHVKDTAKHDILGTQQFKPVEFASQINLNMDNAWGILRCIIDTCMKLKEGKYLIMKDPNKPVIRIYDIPDDTFESDDDDEDDDDDDDDEEDEESDEEDDESDDEEDESEESEEEEKKEEEPKQESPAGGSPKKGETAETAEGSPKKDASSDATDAVKKADAVAGSPVKTIAQPKTTVAAPPPAPVSAWGSSGATAASIVAGTASATTAAAAATPAAAPTEEAKGGE